MIVSFLIPDLIWSREWEQQFEYADMPHATSVDHQNDSSVWK